MEIIFVHLLLGPLVLLIFYIIKSRPPKKINKIYGYRTRLSMKSQEAWDFANEYSTDWMIKCMWTFIFAVQLPCLLFVEPEVGILIAVGLLMMFIFIPIVMTEKRLRQIFDEEGNFREEFV